MAWFDKLAAGLQAWFTKFREEFVLNFIEGDRWKWLVQGLGNTLRITAVALLLGLLIGVVVASVRASYDKNREMLALHGGFGYRLFGFFNWLCRVYLAIIRGTPVVVQLLIMYFVIFAWSRNAILVATLAFGINSGAYVAEIIRGGIMSVDNGQFEAGRSLGFNYVQTMLYIVIPQVFKSVLPALLNEFIALLKETSVAGYVGIMDLTKAGDLIRGRTFSAFMPLIAVALIYLLIVIILTRLVALLEKKLRRSER